MSTISVPLSHDLEQFIEKTVAETGLTKADIMRQALKLYAEEQAVRTVLLAQAEPTLTGDFDDLLDKVGR